MTNYYVRKQWASKNYYYNLIKIIHRKCCVMGPYMCVVWCSFIVVSSMQSFEDDYGCCQWLGLGIKKNTQQRHG